MIDFNAHTMKSVISRMKLYYFSGSPYSQKVLIALQEKGIEVDRVHIDLFDSGEMKQYREIYPLGKLPLLTGEDVYIPESTIIVEYFEGHYPQKGTRLISQNVDDARQVRFKTQMSDNYLVPPARDLYFQGLRSNDKQDKKLIKKAKRMLDIMYDYIDKAAQKNIWMQGDAFTMADCAIAPALIELAHPVYPVPDEKSALLEYMHRSAKRDTVAQVIAEVEAARQL